MQGLHNGPAVAHWLSGCDPTPAVVSVAADRAGHARVWRRLGRDQVEVSEHRFANWFLTTSLDLLAHLPARRWPAERLRAAHGQLGPVDGLAVVELDTSQSDAYRYLVLADRLDEVETVLVETHNKRDGGQATNLADLRGLILIWPPIEQFLLLTGCTYFKGMQFRHLRRLQFDLETTGLDEERDRIFMVSMRDSTGWSDCLDTRGLSEAELIEGFVQRLRARDPDVLENHNIFAFDLPFLVKRAARLGLRLALGRDGSEPEAVSDVFANTERTEPFVRWRVLGREVVDTQHAVRRYATGAPDLRRHGLKDVARYFGFARDGREYVPGAEIWATFNTDPERIRRYAADDVDEVDGLSQRLLPVAFELARLLPRAYESIAADARPGSLWESLLVRAYLHEGRAIPAPMAGPGLGARPHAGRAELLVKGVVQPAAQVRLVSLLPCVLTARAIQPAADELGVFPTLLGQLQGSPRAEASSGAAALVEASYPYLAGQGLFSDPEAATEAAVSARAVVDRLLEDLRTRGCAVIEVDAERVLFATPPDWGAACDEQLATAAATYLPDGVRLRPLGHYQAAYARAPRSTILLGYDGSVTLVGSTFRPGRLERFGEAFMQQAAPRALLGDAPGLRRLFLDTVHRLRSYQLPLEDLCVQVTLHKSPAAYRRSGAHEEPYEVLLAAGVRAWRVGQRIRYFRGQAGGPRLLQEGDGTPAGAADAEYYVQRLCNLYCHQFAQAFTREDFLRIFRLPSGPGPYDEDVSDLAAVRPVSRVLAA